MDVLRMDLQAKLQIVLTKQLITYLSILETIF